MRCYLERGGFFYFFLAVPFWIAFCSKRRFFFLIFDFVFPIQTSFLEYISFDFYCLTRDDQILLFVLNHLFEKILVFL
uniref:Uncharacterized protein n=1 Tax=Siphoviridae sp. ctPZa1 TaxID=2826323 RepID=A0A8S5ND79_9CAUD|nr:MAG TPA: hypothetical protein [Siphoviridae sp. ctPZa1]